VVLLALSAAMAVTSPPAGVLADRVGTGPVVLAGTVAVLGGAAWLLAVPVTPLGLLGPLLLMGVGHGLFAGPNTARVLENTPADEVGTASGLASLVRTLGFTVGPALAALAWTSTGGGPSGLHTTALILVALGVVGVLAGLASTNVPTRGGL
jgi:MFS family permease